MLPTSTLAIIYLMCPPLSSYHRNIEINITDNRHFALVYLLGITRLTFTWSTAQEPSIFDGSNEINTKYV